MLNTPHKLPHYDYAIIGAGVAGLHLAYQLSKNIFFIKKKIIVIDKPSPVSANQVLSFWEKGQGLWDTVIYKSWKKTAFHFKDLNLEIDLKSYTYKTLFFSDFSTYCKKQISKSKNISITTNEVLGTRETEERVFLKLSNSEISATYVFDSRLSENFRRSKYKYPSITQSFKGWHVVFDTPVFDDQVFTMMDYRLPWKNSNSFMYLLPKSSTEALLEYTFFTSFKISEGDFDRQIKAYINTFFPHINYTIKATEMGAIPMTVYAFNHEHTARIRKIGTAGGYVKASTGYSFKFAEKKALAIAAQLEKGEMYNLGYDQPKKRFRFYDKLFLKVLFDQNEKGPLLFSKMYTNDIDLLFRFLDEETRLIEELKFILRLPYKPFIRALFTAKLKLQK